VEIGRCGERIIDKVGISAVRIWIRSTTISEDRGYCFRKGVMVGVDGSLSVKRWCQMEDGVFCGECKGARM